MAEHQTTTISLAWRPLGAGWQAKCGDDDKGLAVVRRYQERWLWHLTMALDDEPISGMADTCSDAMECAQRQVRRWPTLIAGAQRHGG